MSPALSVVVITFNESKMIASCLEAAQKVADEIIVLDSCSTDDTVVIAQSFGAKVFVQPFAGYGKQKNDAISFSSHNWILSLDADEILTPELIAEILELKAKGWVKSAYEVPRLNNYLGSWMRHGGWFPDAKIRLFDKTKGSWKQLSVHEYWEPLDANVTVGRLKQHMLHYTMTDMTQHLQKIEKYSQLSAEFAHEKGKKCSWLKLQLGSQWFFFQRYILKKGFLDGYHGYLFCKMAAFEKWLKYAKIRNLYLQSRH